MKEKNKYTWDGEPIYEAFDSEEECEKAVEEREKEILTLWEDMNRFDELLRTDPDAARAAASRAASEAAALAEAEAEFAESEVTPNSSLSHTRLRSRPTDHRNAESGLLLTPCLRTHHPFLLHYMQTLYNPHPAKFRQIA
ncbi:hypothetical protein Holit_02696 [Hollandina sp. SP2]